ncbi:S-adenosyl-L-methionine-dependent methyltransferase [Martensiomyces pterosporus]|nr:S-adenosyl-L-methionine-dependent methyltransferase [Martensiomyces pterosporus]
MAFETTSNPSREQVEAASADELRTYYATKASINPNLAIASIPPTISKVHEGTVAEVGEDLSEMAVSNYQGILQGFFVGLTKAKRVLEIGTFTGSSAIYFATALKRNGVAGGPDANGHKPVVGLDISEKYAQIARNNFAEAGLDDYIEVVVGSALESLAKLEGQTFDIAFIDADKAGYKAYYDAIIENNLLAKDGLFIIDNTAFNCVTPYIDIPAPVTDDAEPLNVPFSGHPQRKQVGKVLHEFNEYVKADPRTEVVMLPLFTGITLARFV